mmetsp:Transcript_3956/g.5557  ORF Transcript_3956/g.5557 Transcript_3956/m.5557 type:complete len:205 (+) Transcript_3956:839-1453(+)
MEYILVYFLYLNQHHILIRPEQFRPHRSVPQLIMVYPHIYFYDSHDNRLHTMLEFYVHNDPSFLLYFDRGLQKPKQNIHKHIYVNQFHLRDPLYSFVLTQIHLNHSLSQLNAYVMLPNIFATLLDTQDYPSFLHFQADVIEDLTLCVHSLVEFHLSFPHDLHPHAQLLKLRAVVMYCLKRFSLVSSLLYHSFFDLRLAYFFPRR